jgi:hypothetical protein
MFLVGLSIYLYLFVCLRDLTLAADIRFYQNNTHASNMVSLKFKPEYLEWWKVPQRRLGTKY